MFLCCNYRHIVDDTNHPGGQEHPHRSGDSLRKLTQRDQPRTPGRLALQHTHPPGPFPKGSPIHQALPLHKTPWQTLQLPNLTRIWQGFWTSSRSSGLSKAPPPANALRG